MKFDYAIYPSSEQIAELRTVNCRTGYRNASGHASW
jgi:hypothetical protein